jgi:hypothetical protein
MSFILDLTVVVLLLVGAVQLLLAPTGEMKNWLRLRLHVDKAQKEFLRKKKKKFDF